MCICWRWRKRFAEAVMLDLVAPVEVGRWLVRGRMQAGFDEAVAGTQTHFLAGYWRAQPVLARTWEKSKSFRCFRSYRGNCG